MAKQQQGSNSLKRLRESEEKMKKRRELRNRFRYHVREIRTLGDVLEEKALIESQQADNPHDSTQRAKTSYLIGVGYVHPTNPIWWERL